MCKHSWLKKVYVCVCVYVIHTYVHVYSLYVYVEARGESLNLESAFLARWIWHCAPLISWGSWCMPPCLAFDLGAESQLSLQASLASAFLIPTLLGV